MLQLTEEAVVEAAVVSDWGQVSSEAVAAALLRLTMPCQRSSTTAEPVTAVALLAADELFFTMVTMATERLTRSA